MAVGQPSVAGAVDSTRAHRDYSLNGTDARAAAAKGLVEAEWFRPAISPARLQELMKRRNGPAIRDTTLWFALIGGTGVLAYLSLGTWWSILAFAVYGALYGGSSDPRWHENGHGTAFRTRWPNDVVYVIASFMLMREPTLWRWSHVRHHSNTIIVGLDPEISFPRPFKFRAVVPNYFNLISGPRMIWRMIRHAFGSIDDDARIFVPEDELGKVKWEARAFVGILLAVVLWCVIGGTFIPLLFIGLPSFYGVWLVWFFAITQHAGLREDVLDHRYSTRTVYMNPVFRFLYLNMNYHLEHHLFPAVPYHALPALHKEVKDQLPAAKTSMWDAYREIYFALKMQRRNPDWELPGREVPEIEKRRYAQHVSSQQLGTATAVAASLATEVDLGSADHLAVGQIERVDIGERTFVLCRVTEDHFRVVDGLCTHGSASLAEGYLNGCEIECPKHNGRFDVNTGAPTRRPVKLPITTYDVRVENNRLLAQL